MGFFSRILSHFLHDAAVNKLASNKTFQSFAVRTVEAQEALAKLAADAAKDPHKAQEHVRTTATTFLSHFRAQMQRDIERLNASLADDTRKAASKLPPKAGGTGS